MSKKFIKTISIDSVPFETTSAWGDNNEVDIPLAAMKEYCKEGMFLRVYAASGYSGETASIQSVYIVHKEEETDEEYKERIKQEAIAKDEAEKQREKDMLAREKAEYKRLKKKYGK